VRGMENEWLCWWVEKYRVPFLLFNSFLFSTHHSLFFSSFF
jgi:hypothetical protein